MKHFKKHPTLNYHYLVMGCMTYYLYKNMDRDRGPYKYILAESYYDADIGENRKTYTDITRTIAESERILHSRGRI